jgi:predicted Fe-Mo cluster-binding NifX family protein
MKIGITVDKSDLEATVTQRFGLCRYLLIVDSENLSWEALPNPGASGSTHSGIEMVILSISNGVEVLITGYLSPTAEKHLTENGIRVIRGVQGTAATAINSLREGKLDLDSVESAEEGSVKVHAYVLALKRSFVQFAGLLPVMVGVILLIGLSITFLSKETVTPIFSGNVFHDAFFGSCLGSLLTGNPINSYLIGAGLLRQGVSLFGVTAFMLAWVSVGLLQLPAEIAALGKRFAFARTGLSFCLAMAVSILTTALFYLFQG